MRKGDRIAIAGANRPRLYWSITAAQMLGAIPVPVYADSVAEEIALVLEHAGASLLVAQDQEQVDKALAIIDGLPSLTQVLYDEARGLRDYDDARLASLDDVIAKGRAALADPAIAGALDRRIDAGRRPRPFRHPLYLGNDGPLQGRGADAASAASRRRATPSPSTT